MDYKPYIRFVNTHTECDCSNNHIYLLHKEEVLVGRSGGSVEPGMVRACLYAVYIEQFCKLFNLFAAKAVYDSRFALVAFYEFYDLFLSVYLRPHFIVEVLPVE